VALSEDRTQTENRLAAMWLGLLKDDPKALRVWRFDEAPKVLQALSRHGGDEDWLLAIPPECAHLDIWWAEVGSQFGVCDVSTHKLPNGWEVRIGAHA
jgi:hypothetical protein